MINLHQTPSTHYRVEYHDGRTIRPLGCLVGVAPHHATLEPFLSQLLREGAEGTLVLIHQETGEIVARRVVKRFSAKGRDRFLEFGD